MRFIIFILLLVSSSAFSQNTGGELIDFKSEFLGPSPVPVPTQEQPCYRECKKGLERKVCLPCLQDHPDLYKLDEKILGSEAKPCYRQCSKGIEKKDCALCIVKNPKTFQLGSGNNQLADCNKNDDSRSISCPDGLYIKSSSVIDAKRGNTKENGYPASQIPTTGLPPGPNGIGY